MKTVGIFFFISLGLFNTIAWSEEARPEHLSDGPSIQELIDEARQKNLDKTRQWEKLLHLEKNAIGIKSSQIIDPEFFLAQRELAKYNELEATIYAMFTNAKEFQQNIAPPVKKHLYKEGETIVDHSRHPICRFPARLKFLRSNLNSDPDIWNRLPKVECVYQGIFNEALDAAKISYVFSSYYSDSPGSAFGHTFFRVQRKSNLKAQQELLDYGLSYAANVTTSNGLLYALLGLVGGFSGTWANLPYYYKVREYNDFEARDLWSYELNLTQDEVDMFTRHMWEVGAHYYRYFFFSQNCAFQMLTVLEAAAPRLYLSDKVPFYYVIPSDSLKALFVDQNLVTDIQFRPSLRRNFFARLDRLDDESEGGLKKFIEDNKNLSALDFKDPAKSSYAIDAAMDYMDLKYAKKIMDPATEEFKIKEDLLSKRAQINYVSPELKFDIRNEQDPAKSHGSSRFNFAATNMENQYYFGYRFALHDMLDPNYGLPENSQIEFFDFKFLAQDNVYYLDKFSFFSVLNLNPITFYDRKLSWGAEIGADSHKGNCEDGFQRCLLYGVKARFGPSAQIDIATTKHYFWIMGITQLRYGNDLKDKYLFASPGVEIGYLSHLPYDFNFKASVSREFPVEMEAFTSYDVELRKSFYNKWALSVQSEDDMHRVGFYYYF